MITTVAQARVITGVKRSPAGPEANEPLSPFHLCTGRLCLLQIAGELWFTSVQPPTSLSAKKKKKAGQLVPIISDGAVII